MLLGTYFILQTTKVQLWLSKKVSGIISEKLNTTVDVKGIDIDLFSKVVLEGLYVEDQHKDTLLYAERLKLAIGKLGIFNNEINITDITLLNTRTNLVKYTNETEFNYQFIIDAFDSKTPKKDSTIRWQLNLEGISLVNVKLAYKNEHDTSKSRGINFSDLYVDNINARISDPLFQKDTIRATIDYLSAREKTGFILKNLSCYVKLSPVGMQLDELKITTPTSRISTDLIFQYKAYNDFNHFIDHVVMKAHFDKTLVDLSDIAYFAPELKGIYRKLTFSGEVTGKVSELKGRNLDIVFGKSTNFMGDVDFMGLPNIDETFIHLNVKRLATTKADLEQIPVPPFRLQKNLSIPNNIGLLGLIKFKGTFSGFFSDFVAYGDFTTALGRVSSDIALKQDGKGKRAKYKGKVKSYDFDIGKFLSLSKHLGKVDVDAEVNGYGLYQDSVSVSVKGVLKRIEFNQYTYKNVDVEGKLSKKIFNGFLSIEDENIKLVFNGDIDFNQEVPQLDFAAVIDNANLGALRLIQTDKLMKLSSRLEVKASGDNIDDFLGEINIVNTVYQENDRTFKLQRLNLTSSVDNGVKQLILLSDVADAYIRGNFLIGEIPRSFKQFFTHYLPSYSSALSTKEKENVFQSFDYAVEFKNTGEFTKLFLPQVSVVANTKLSGNYNSSANTLSVSGSSPKITLYGYELEQWFLEGTAEGTKLHLNTGGKKLLLSDSLGLEDFVVSTITHSDSINLGIRWDNKVIPRQKGAVNGTFTFMEQPRIKFKFIPSEVIIADSIWTVNTENEINIDSTYIEVNNLHIRNHNQSINLQGALSEVKTDVLYLTFSDFDIAAINPFVRNKGIQLRGKIDGKASITDAYDNIVFNSSLSFNNLFINNEVIGNGMVESSWDKSKKAVSLKGAFTKGIVPNIEFSGLYYPSKEKENIDLELRMQAMRMQLFEPYVKEYCSDLKGQFTGIMKIGGSLEKPRLSGKINVQAKKVTVNYLNTSYSFTHDISIEDNSFGVDDLILSDMFGNTATVTGKVYHSNFKDFQLDFDVNTKKFMCLNTTESLNDLYYGKAFVSGIINIFGFVDNVKIDASVKTEKVNVGAKTEITKLFIPLSGPQEVNENNFITFVKHDSSAVKKAEAYKVNLKGIQLELNLEVTPNAEVQLIFDSKAGDIIKGRGNGDIKLYINTLGNFNMYGNYYIEDGDYLFTLQNLINKRFDLEEGGIIKWTGNPYDADVNLSALYRLRASLMPVLLEDSTRRRYPVDCKLIMSGKLMSPEINFDINFPTLDETTKRKISFLSSAQANEQEINRQVFSLLVLNSFAPAAGQDGAGSNAGAAAANSTELLSNQLSNMLSKISNDFDIGVNYRPGDEISSEELELALSTQLFNDRVVIDGNVGVSNGATTNSNANNLIGDVNVEYKLSEDGKLRVKAFNKTNNQTIESTNSPYTQGVGVFYREEFESIQSLYRKYLNKLRKENKK